MKSLENKRILVPGSILLDIYADTQSSFLGGAEFNFAYHLHQLAGNLDFIGRVGSDQAGRQILRQLEQRNFPSTHIQIDRYKRTKTVHIKKNKNNEPVFLIPDNVASEFLEWPAIPEDRLKKYGIIYFGTTLQHGQKSRSTLRALLDKCPGLKFCDINLRTGKYTPETLDYSLGMCDYLKINHEELNVLARQYALTGTDGHRLEQISERFSIRSVCLTLAERGSMLYWNKKLYEHTLVASEAVIDTVGAGDAFSACLIVGLLQGWTPQRQLSFASDFARAICRIQGAVPADNTFYDSWKKIIHSM